ncbi:hypothetical protein [Nocardia sp. NPDC059239]|uniref:hypothetical protein n=1 Tax=unclassified Nocardia TaxID=2637762 RepID=UPI0036AC0073
MRPVPPEFAEQIAELDKAREAAFAALRAANARGLTGRDVDAMVTAMEEIEARCEELRRRYFPRRHKLVLTCGVAMLMSKSYRRAEIVWDRSPRVAGAQ